MYDLSISMSNSMQKLTLQKNIKLVIKEIFYLHFFVKTQ